MDEDKQCRVTFLGKQVLSVIGNRYTNDDIGEAIHLFLRSRNSYRALRDILALPCANTIREYFAKQGLVGGLREGVHTHRLLE